MRIDCEAETLLVNWSSEEKESSSPLRELYYSVSAGVMGQVYSPV